LPASKRPLNPPFPEPGAITALRARLQGVAAVEAMKRYVPERMRRGGSARQVLQEIRSELVRFAGVRGRVDLGQAITESATQGIKGLAKLDRALELLRHPPPAPPQIGDEVERWLARTFLSFRRVPIDAFLAAAMSDPRRGPFSRSVHA